VKMNKRQFTVYNLQFTGYGSPTPHHTPRISKLGFTFIEMLIVTVTLSVISLAIYATFNNGIKIWQKINKQIPEEDLTIFFDRFSSDLKNSFKFTGLTFSGKEDELEFATILNSPALHKRTVGKVVYFYDPYEKILNREEKDFSQIYENKKGSIQQSIRDVKSLRFRYYFYDAERKEYLWQDEWESEELPLAVRIQLELEYGTENNKFVKTVNIPTSS